MRYLFDQTRDEKQGVTLYHIGYPDDNDIYDDFLGWAKDKIRYSGGEMFHHYFVFRNESDRVEFDLRYGSTVSPVEYRPINLSNFHDNDAPVDKTTFGYMLWEILNEEIVKEINREILEKLGKSL